MGAEQQAQPKVDPRQLEMMRLNDQLDEILEWAGRSGVSNAAKDSNMQIQKQIRQLENRLEKELDQKKKEMANIIEISNSAYESRDQAQQEMQALKKQLEEEQAAFEEEWKDLGRIIEADRV